MARAPTRLPPLLWLPCAALCLPALTLPSPFCLRLQAYPSSSNMQQGLSCSFSYRSDGSGLAAADTPRSSDSSALERKVRGGMARSLSYQSASRALLPGGAGLAGSLVSHPSLPKQASNASLGGITSCRTSGDFRSASAPGSPGGEGPLSAPLSPQQSPLAAPLGGGGCARAYAAGGRVVHSLTPLQGFAGMQHADLVARGSHLSRRATDPAGLAEALTAIDEAEGRALPHS